MMAKNIKKIMAMVLALCMCFSALPLQALAAEGDIIEEKDGITYVEGKTETKPDGSVSVTINHSGTNSKGETVTGSETTTKDADGNVTKVEGGETKSWTEDVKPGEDFSVNGPVDVTITDNGNGTFTFEGSATGEEKDVDIKGFDDAKSTDKITVSGSVTITGEDFEITLSKDKDGNIDEEALYCPVAPEDYEGKVYHSTNENGNYNVSDHKNDNNKHNLHINGSACTDCAEHLEGVLRPNKEANAELEEKYPGYEFIDPKPTPDDEDYEDKYKEGYDMVWTGNGEGTNAAIPVWVKYKYETDENGEIKKDEKGDPIYKYETNEDGSVKIDEFGNPVKAIDHYVVGGQKYNDAHGMVSQASQFILRNENGNYFYAYCMDASTGASPEYNEWYHITNIESAIYDEKTNPDGYLSREDAEHIKKIATYGYWGTDHNVYDENGNVVYEKDENGNVKVDANGNKTIVTDSSVRGSVASLVEMVKRHYYEVDAEGNFVLDKNNNPKVKEGMITQITVEYPTGNDQNDSTHDDKTKVADILAVIEGLTESEALAVTQAAIWSYSNKNDIDYVYKGNVKDSGLSVAGVLSAMKMHSTIRNGQTEYGYINEYLPYKDIESDVRMEVLYNLLMNISDEDVKHIKLPEEKESTVIPNEDVVTGAALVIKDKATEENMIDEFKGQDLNSDNNADNDVYNTDLNFTLAFVPDPKTDDMMVYLYVEGQAEPKQYRLAGGEDGKNDVVYNKDGSFTLQNIQLQEGSTGFDLQIHGTQYLNEGVYIYQAQGPDGPRKTSQTLVGLAAGKQDFTSSTKMTIDFTVDEERNVVAQRTWIKTNPVEEQDPPVGPDVPPQEPPQVFNLNREGVVEIIDEQVPLAAAPKTGDASFLFIALALFAAISLCAANFDKKRKHEAF